MFWWAILLVSVTKYVASENPILSPKFSDVIENSSLEFMCNVRKNAKMTHWSSSNRSNKYSILNFTKEGVCEIDGFLNDTQYFETSCYSNGTYKVKIKRVNVSNHDQEWYCVQEYEKDSAKIYVQVPIKFVKIGKVSGTVLSAVENIKTTITCMTSEGRPDASIAWTRLSKKGIKTDLTQTAVYNISEQDNGMIISQSSIDLRPLRGDNDTRIICEATNKISNITRREVTLHVQYPPGKPYFQYIAPNEFEKDGKLKGNQLIVKEGNSFTVICRSDGDPPPTCTWNTSNDVNSPNLTFTDITKARIGLYECTAANVIQSFPKYDKKTSTSKAGLDINVQYPSRILQFRASGKEMKKGHFEVTENETIHFICSVDSNPESLISLSFKEQDLWRNVSKGLVYTHRVESCFDDGVYNCLANNTYNNKPSKEELTLRVRCTPLLSPEFELTTNITCAQNVSVTFQFKYVAYPNPTFEWCYFIGSSCKTLNNDKKFEITTYGLKSSLIIRDITEDDYGRYKLKINNTVGTLEQVYFLKANGKPDPPTWFKYLAVDIAGTSIILQWKPGFNGGPGQTFILRFKLEPGSKWTRVNITDDGDEIMNYTLTNLKRNSVYFSELFSVNSEGQSMTQNLTFKTTDFQRLSETPIHYVRLILYCCGGVVGIVAVYVGTCFIVKRRKKQSTLKVIYQNVPPSVPDTENIYQNMPSCSIKETNKGQKAIYSRKAAVGDFQEVKVEPEDEVDTDDLEELDELIPEQTEYINSLDLIDKLDKIKVSELFDYVKDRADEAFSYDFQSIPTAFQMPCLFARSPENKTSNRYKGIMPYDHSRVQIDGQPDFYINASYIDGYKRQKAYIACLGPTSATHDNFKTFWKMVWHEKVEIIVMVTNLNEPSGMKCEQYWPDVSQVEDYGDVHVSCQNIQIFADYTFRTFKVINNAEKGDVCRRLVHLHYTSWPDKKTPEDVISLLEFRQKYRDVKTSLNGPIIVHCSAGIGRTGVFIAVDRLIMEGNREGTVNVPACLNKMREQRVKMVQTSEQYKFIFKALVYALCLNCELIPVENIEEHVNDTDENSLNRQYKELEFSLEKNVMDDMNSESEYENLTDKGRPGADILDNPNRVCLYLNRAFKDTDFINAVYVNSYKWKDHFIMAQSPLPASVTDFVTMIYQENCSCIVSMDDIHESGTVVNKYLPAENESLEKGGFIVSCFAFDTKAHYTVRKVTIKNKENSNDERDYYHFQYKKWTAGIDVPVRAEDFVDFVKDVEEYATLSKENARVLVHCLNGNKRSGIFCAVAILMEKLLYDQQVSVMNTLRQLKKRRPYAISEMGQMMFCYQAARAIVQMHRKNCIRYDHLL